MSTRCVSISELMHSQVSGREFLALRGFKFTTSPCTKGTSSERPSAPCSGPILATLGIVPLLRHRFRISTRVVELVAYPLGSAGFSLICSRLTGRTLSYDDLPSRSTGKRSYFARVGSSVSDGFLTYCNEIIGSPWRLTPCFIPLI